MSWLRVNRCICGCNLKTGTLILLWISVVAAGLQLTSELMNMTVPRYQSSVAQWYHSYQFFSSLAILACSVAGIYAIEKNKPSLLLPFIWYNILSLIISILVIFILPIFWSSFVNSKAFDDSLNEIIKEQMEKHNAEEEEKMKAYVKDKLINVFLPTIEIILVVCTVLGIYFTIVMYSCYKMMLEEYQRPILYDAAIIESKPGYPSLPPQDFTVPSYPVHPPPYVSQPNEYNTSYKKDNESTKYPVI